MNVLIAQAGVTPKALCDQFVANTFRFKSAKIELFVT